jgi:hypothetical protein
MPKVCNINIEHREKVYKDLALFIRRLKNIPQVKKAYLYGSFAQGDIHEGSDIDLIVVGDFKGKIFERIKLITSLTDLPVEPLVYTPEEFEYKKKAGNPFLLNILKHTKKVI